MQEKIPPIGKYIDKARLDPLHVVNLAWQHWYKRVVVRFVNESQCGKNIKMADSLLGEHLDTLSSLRLKRLKKQVAKQLSEKPDIPVSVRLTGEESKSLCEHSVEIIRPLLTGDDKADFIPIVLIYIATMLGRITSLILRMNVNEDDLANLKTACLAYHRAHVLFLTPNLTSWTVGFVAPYHAVDLFRRFGLGLGINTMQGRESKHQQIKRYLAHSPPSTASTRWQTVTKHEFAEQILLPDATGKDFFSRPKSGKENVKLPNDPLLVQKKAVLDLIQASVDGKSIDSGLQKYVK